MFSEDEYLKTKFPTPTAIEWVDEKEKDSSSVKWTEVCINGECVAVLEKRPHYCDRGHYWVKCFLPYLDSADMFPRYYMSEDVARSETEAFLKWRLWKQRAIKIN
jgi:hypothetical protein